MLLLLIFSYNNLQQQQSVGYYSIQNLYKIKLSMHYSFKSTPTWTMRGRPLTSDAQKHPGPAHYDAKKPLYRTGTISAVTQERDFLKNLSSFPGPGSYQLKSSIGLGPKRSMSARHFQSVKLTPGPHQYDNNTLKVKAKAPHFSMSTRSKSTHQINFDKNKYTPAPTTYQYNSTLGKNKSIVIGSSSRKDLTETQKTPAPNYYQSEKASDYAGKTNPKFGMGSQMRKSNFDNVNKTPGPNVYDKKGLFEQNKQKKKGYSCRNKTPDRIALQISKFPGPGQYQSPLKNKHNGPTFASTNALRKGFTEENKEKKTPGPGQHNLNFSSSKHRASSAYNFGRANRRPLWEYETTPGPAEYKNQKIEVMRAAPKFSVTKTVGKAEYLGVNPQTPGPGAYDPSLVLVKESSKMYEVSKQLRPGFDKQKYTPGPGYYNLRGKQDGPGWVFPKQLRIAFTDKKSQAKHGQHYQIPSKVVDPPSYMKVQSKIKYDSPSKTAYSTLNSAQKSPNS